MKMNFECKTIRANKTPYFINGNKNPPRLPAVVPGSFPAKFGYLWFINIVYMATARLLATIPDFTVSPHIDQVGVEERAARFTKRSIKKESKMYGV